MDEFDEKFDKLFQQAELGKKLAVKAGRAIYGVPYLKAGRWWVHDAWTNTHMTTTDFLNIRVEEIVSINAYINKDQIGLNGIIYPN